VVSTLRQQGPCVVVIDGVDAVADAIATLVRVAADAGEVRFVVTQRAAVDAAHSAHVTAFTVGPLGTARKQGREENEATQLFVERMSEARGTLTRTLSAADLTAVANIVRHLEGVPQAIELAAVRCRVLSPGELLERLPRNLQTLSPSSGQKSALSGVVAWSLDLLQSWERATLAQCVIFHGGFTGDAARAVVDLSEVPGAPDVGAAIESLVEKALLKVSVVDDDDEIRFVHPPAVRDLIVAVRPARSRTMVKTSTLELLPGVFSAEGNEVQSSARIELSTSREALVKRHSTWVLSRCGALKEGVDTHGGLVARRQLEREQENLLAVVRRSLSEEVPSWASLTHALLALAALEPVMTTRGPHELFAKLLDRALDPAETTGVAPALVARCLEIRARLRRGRGQLAGSKADLDGALVLARKAKDHLLEGRALANLGTHALFVGEFDLAREEYNAAIEIIRSERDLRLEGRCVGFFGLLDEETGDLAAAAQHYENAIEIHVKTGDRRWEGIHLTQLGRVRLAEGKLDEAHGLLRRSLVIHREFWNRRLEAITLFLLGDLAAATKNVVDAEGLWGRAAKLARDIGDPTLQALGFARLSFALRHPGDSLRPPQGPPVERDECDAIVASALARIDDASVVAATHILQETSPAPALDRRVHVRAAVSVVKAWS